MTDLTNAGVAADLPRDLRGEGAEPPFERERSWFLRGLLGGVLIVLKATHVIVPSGPRTDSSAPCPEGTAGRRPGDAQRRGSVVLGGFPLDGVYERAPRMAWEMMRRCCLMALPALAAIALSVSCDSGGYKRVSLSPSQAGVAPQSPGQDPLRLGMAPILSARSGGEGLAALCAALSRALGRPVSPLLGADYAEINDMLALGQLDAGILCTGAFADPKLSRSCEVLLVPQLPEEGSYYRSLIVVRRGDPARRFEDLQGRSAVFTDALSLTGYLYPLSRLCAMGKKPSTFFGALSFTHSHDRSIVMVVDGLADAAAVDSAVFGDWLARDAAHEKELRILDRSNPFPSPPIVVRASLAPSERDRLRKAFLDLTATDGGRAVLKQVGWSGLREPDLEYLDRLRTTIAFMKGLHDQDCLSP